MLFKKKNGKHDISMYIEVSALKVSDTVQRDIDLEDLLLNHTRFYDDDKVAYDDGYVPLSFSTSVRTVYSNRVAYFRDGRNNKYYETFGTIKLPHKGLDLIMYLSSVALFKFVEYKKGFDDIMLHSEFQSIGIYNPNPDLVTPIIYSHIYIDDEQEETFKKYFRKKCGWIDIAYAREHTDGNIEALIDTLIITTSKKEENKNE